MMRTRLSLTLAALLVLAAPLAAQDTTAVRTMTARQKLDADSIAKISTSPRVDRISARVKLRADSIATAAKPTPAPRPDSLPPQPPVVDSAPKPIPPTPQPSTTFIVPQGLGGGVATVAELPRRTVDVTYPTTTGEVRVPAGANLQTALGLAKPGDVILLPRGSVFVGGFMLPRHACTAPIVIRTDVPDSLLGAPGVRMTPAKAAALQLAKLESPDNQQAIGSAMGVPSVGCWRLVGLEIMQQPGNANATNANGLVRFGDHTATDSTTQAHDLILDRSYVHGPGVRRCVILNSQANAVVDSWLEKCSGGSGDTQSILFYAGTGPYLVKNNHLSGGTEVVMSGGASGGIVGAVPSDAQIHGNLITRELADTSTLVKNLVEVKNAERFDIAGNEIVGNWPNGQVGFAVLLKSVNQSSGPCTWCRARDITVRYNRIARSGNGLNLSGIQESPAQPAARFTVYHNLIDSLGYRGGQGIPFGILGSNGTLSDVIIAHNTVTNQSYKASGNWGLVSYDGGPVARQAWQSNVLWCGGYGAKGTSTGQGLPTITAFAPGVVWTGNVLFGCSSNYPSGTTFSASLSAALSSGAGVDVDALAAAIKAAEALP